MDQFKQITGQSDESIREEMGKDASNKVKVRLVLEAIAAEEKLKSVKKNVNAEIERIAKHVIGIEVEPKRLTEANPRPIRRALTEKKRYDRANDKYMGSKLYQI